MRDTPSICRFCGTALLWGQTPEGHWVSLEPNAEGLWVRDGAKRCWKLMPEEPTSLPRYDPHRPLCAQRVKAAETRQTTPPLPKPSPQLDLWGKR